MNVAQERFVADLADLNELIARADILAGDLLAEAMRLEWTPPADHKQDPHPKPIPKPPPPPKPPQPKGTCRCPACIASRHPQSDGSCRCPLCISGRPT